MQGYFNSRRIRVCPLPLAPLFLTCAPSKRVYSRLSDTEYTSPEYRTVLDKWMRKGSINKGLGIELLITTTYKGREFRSAFAEEYGRLYLQTPQENQKMIADQLPTASD